MSTSDPRSYRIILVELEDGRWTERLFDPLGALIYESSSYSHERAQQAALEVLIKKDPRAEYTVVKKPIRG
jgi:hypothetical protein